MFIIWIILAILALYLLSGLFHLMADNRRWEKERAKIESEKWKAETARLRKGKKWWQI